MRYNYGSNKKQHGPNMSRERIASVLHEGGKVIRLSERDGI